MDVLLAVLLSDDGIDDDDKGGDGGGDDDDVVSIHNDAIDHNLTFARKHLLLKKLTTSFVSTWTGRNQGEGGHFIYVKYTF